MVLDSKTGHRVDWPLWIARKTTVFGFHLVGLLIPFDWSWIPRLATGSTGHCGLHDRATVFEFHLVGLWIPFNWSWIPRLATESTGHCGLQDDACRM